MLILCTGSAWRLRHRHQRVARFMKRHPAFFLRTQPPAFPLGTGHDFFHGRFHLVLGNPLGLAACGQQGGLIDHIRQIGPGKPRRLLGDLFEIHVLGKRFVPDVKSQNRDPPCQIGRIEHHLPVEPARPQQRPVESLRPVGCGENDDAEVGLEAVHSDQQLFNVCSRSSLTAPI